MTYAVHVDIEPPTGSPELDPLQREGVAALLDGRIASITSIEGPDEMQVQIEDHRVAAHPSGALLLVMADAPALEFAEQAVHQAVAQVLEDTELLAEWTVVKSRVELNDELVLESLAAADGPDTPPADLRERAAAHAAAPAAGTPLSAEEREKTRARIDRCADQLTAFSLADFGAYEDEDDDGGGFGVPMRQARLAAGALVYAIEILIDELFHDVQTLARGDESVTGVDDCLVLSDLPPCCAEQYTGLFAKRFLVSAAVLTARLTGPGWAPLASVAEELALRLLITQAQIVLDLYELSDQETGRALEALRGAAFEDFDHEDLYGDCDEDGLAQIDANAWFAPFAPPRCVHPYVHDPHLDRR